MPVRGHEIDRDQIVQVGAAEAHELADTATHQCNFEGCYSSRSHPSLTGVAPCSEWEMAGITKRLRVQTARPFEPQRWRPRDEMFG
jgi:hypothetical protein